MALNIPLPSPKVMVPKHSLETRRPVLPRVAYFMACCSCCWSEVSGREGLRSPPRRHDKSLNCRLASTHAPGWKTYTKSLPAGAYRQDSLERRQCTVKVIIHIKTPRHEASTAGHCTQSAAMNRRRTAWT